MGLYFEILGLVPSLLMNPYNYDVNKKTKIGSQKQILWPAYINCANPTSVPSAIALHNSCQVVLVYLPQDMNMLSCSTQSKHAGARPHYWLPRARLCLDLRFSKVPSRCGPCVHERADPTAKDFLSPVQPLCRIPTLGLTECSTSAFQETFF